MSGEPFAVILPGDVMFSDRSVLKTLVDLYESHQAAAIALTGEPTAKPHESESSIEGLWQSVCLGSGVYRLGPQALDEATTAAHLTIAGRLVLDPTFFDYVEPPDDDDVRHQLERTVRCYAKQNTVMGLLIHDKCVRVETRMDYLVATVEAGLRQPDVGVEFANYLSKVRDEN